jgi:5-methylcytosine-specific restriction endonuclease McrA
VTAGVLDMAALVLNRRWQPVRQTTVRDALTLLAKGAAHAITDDFQSLDFASWAEIAAEPERPVVRTVRLSIPAPTLVRLLGYDRLPVRDVVFSRRNLFKRDRNACQYCGRRIQRMDEITIDHVVPRSRGGVSSWENCVLACLPCNKRKADRTPREAGMTLVRRPVRPKVRVLLSVPVGRVYQSWRSFVSDRYWDVELEP